METKQISLNHHHVRSPLWLIDYMQVLRLYIGFRSFRSHYFFHVEHIPDVIAVLCLQLQHPKKSISAGL